jgi:hypothetical protein
VELVSSLLYVYLNGTVDDFDITIINVPHLDNNLQVSPHAISVYIPYAIGHIRRFYNAIISSSLDLIFMALLGVLVLLLLFLFFAWFCSLSFYYFILLIDSSHADLKLARVITISQVTVYEGLFCQINGGKQNYLTPVLKHRIYT